MTGIRRPGKFARAVAQSLATRIVRQRAHERCETDGSQGESKWFDKRKKSADWNYGVQSKHIPEEYL